MKNRKIEEGEKERDGKPSTSGTKNEKRRKSRRPVFDIERNENTLTVYVVILFLLSLPFSSPSFFFLLILFFSFYSPSFYSSDNLETMMMKLMVMMVPSSSGFVSRHEIHPSNFSFSCLLPAVLLFYPPPSFSTRERERERKNQPHHQVTQVILIENSGFNHSECM